jgi:CelD/BcsL family acetyltransferase involved in cellulose biosynthesis
MRNGDVSMENDSGYNDEKGDFGMELEKRRRHRRRKRYSKQWRYIAMRRIKNDNKRKKIKAIEALLKNVHI